MRRWWFKRKELHVDFCDRCGSVCDAACRRDALLRRTGDTMQLAGRL